MFRVYVHGFNSGPESRSGHALEALLAEPVFRVRQDYSRSFTECLASLEKQIADAAEGAPLCIMGTSLGGFYALQLRLANIAKVAAFNPVIYPALQLAQFVGENTRFTDGEKWHFSRGAQLSYAKAPDPRPWRNDLWLASSNGKGLARPDRKIFLGRRDDLLDHELAEAFWRGHAQLELLDCGHSVEDFSPARDFLKK